MKELDFMKNLIITDKKLPTEAKDFLSKYGENI